MLNQHLTEEILVNFAEELLPQEEAAKVKNHLTTCAKCAAEAAKFSQIISLIQKDKSKDAPADSIIWAKNLFRSKITEPKKSILQKILAVLEMDLSNNQPVFGERSASIPIRQMLFRADDIGITIKISSDEDQISLMGQILDEKFGGCEVILNNDNHYFSANANELSEFKIQDVPIGIYLLTIRNNEKEISLENLELS